MGLKAHFNVPVKNHPAFELLIKRHCDVTYSEIQPDSTQHMPTLQHACFPSNTIKFHYIKIHNKRFSIKQKIHRGQFGVH